MKKYVFLLVAAFNLSIECATVRIQNNWNKPIGAVLNKQLETMPWKKEFDFLGFNKELGCNPGNAVDKFAAGMSKVAVDVYTLGLIRAGFFASYAREAKQIDPTKRLYFDSGLRSIKRISFVFENYQYLVANTIFRVRLNSVAVYPNFSALSVERRIFFNNPTDIRAGDKRLKIKGKKDGGWSDWKWTLHSETNPLVKSVLNFWAAPTDKEQQEHQNLLNVINQSRPPSENIVFEKQLVSITNAAKQTHFSDKNLELRKDKVLAALEAKLKKLSDIAK